MINALLESFNNEQIYHMLERIDMGHYIFGTKHVTIKLEDGELLASGDGLEFIKFEEYLAVNAPKEFESFSIVYKERMSKLTDETSIKDAKVMLKILDTTIHGGNQTLDDSQINEILNSLDDENRISKLVFLKIIKKWAEKFENLYH
jgi:hypothetical protein